MEGEKRLTAYILQEDEHLDNVKKIISRDFFPHIYKIQQPPSNNTLPEIGLNNYLANFKSDENENFSKLVKDDEQEWREKHWWVAIAHKDQAQKQKILMASEEKKFIHMLEGTKQNDLALPPAEEKNALFFPKEQEQSETKELDHELAVETVLKDKKIIYQNTRFDEMTHPLEFGIKKKQTSEYNLDAKVLETPVLMGMEDEEAKKNLPYDLDGFKRPQGSKKKIVENQKGYKLLTIPTPNPDAMKSPFMTFGQIQGTPYRLPEYRVPSTPDRDMVLDRLNQNIVDQKKQQKKRNNSNLIRILGSVTPTLLKSLSKAKDNSSVYRKVNDDKKSSNSIKSKDTGKEGVPPASGVKSTQNSALRSDKSQKRMQGLLQM